MVRDARNEQREPATVAVETTNHPLGNPYTKPAIVTVLEYPIKGGNADTKVKAHNIIHPPLISLHFFAAGASIPNMRSLKTRNRMPSVKEMRTAIITRIL